MIKISQLKSHICILIYVMALLAIFIYSSKKAPIKALIVKKALIKVLVKCLDYVDIFLPNLAIGLLKHNRINNHAINLVKRKQLFYGPIYSLDLLEL